MSETMQLPVLGPKKNMKPVPSTGKHATGAERGESCGQDARERSIEQNHEKFNSSPSFIGLMLSSLNGQRTELKFTVISGHNM